MPSLNNIVILTGNHLCHNPRVVKEASALANAGYDVEVLGGWTNLGLKSRDKKLLDALPFHYTPVLDTTTSDLGTKLHKQVCRLRGKIGQLACQVGKMPNSWQFGYAASALGRAARARQADLFIAHSEAGMMAALDLLDSGHCVALDMEDWFSEDLLPSARRQRPIELLRSLERALLNRGIYSTASSYAMSKALVHEFKCNEPIVIYNSFNWADRQALDGLFLDRVDRKIPSIHWVSQSIGPGRGLEDLFSALPYLQQEVEIHLRGNPVGDFDAWLDKQITGQWRKRIFIHELVPNEVLLSRIAEHDIGFAGEIGYCRNKDLTVSNKMLHYLLAGLAVVATDTAGQREVAEQSGGSVHLYPSGDAIALASCLNALLASPDRLQSCKQAALQIAEQTFCWEKQEPMLLELIARSLCEAPALIKLE